ncbi:tetraspanin-8-like [Polyodon spathula]|uniref:tetraspanin-8-like n=1 Tax=Polyodon spathula TaxID=7913 RepID=UPI001B7ED5E2|nr:tetraspanin-8-like [Polyodon spathula]
MSKVSTCLKYLLMIFNFVFGVAGGVLLILGIVAKRYHIAEPERDTLNYPKDVAIVIGGITMAIAFCGGYGAKKENKCMLGLFFTGLLICLIVLLIVAVPMAMFKSKVFEEIETGFRNHIPLLEKAGTSWDSLQKGGECCGLVNGYEDWGSQIPDSCNCVAFSASDCVEVQEKRSWLTNYDLPRKVYKQPCMYVVFEILELAFKLFLGFTFGFAVIALIGMILSMTMYCQVRKKSNYSNGNLPPQYSEIIKNAGYY